MRLKKTIDCHNSCHYKRGLMKRFINQASTDADRAVTPCGAATKHARLRSTLTWVARHTCDNSTVTTNNNSTSIQTNTFSVSGSLFCSNNILIKIKYLMSYKLCRILVSDRPHKRSGTTCQPLMTSLGSVVLSISQCNRLSYVYIGGSAREVRNLNGF